MSADFQQQIDAIAARVAALEQARWTGEPRLGPRQDTPAEIQARTDRLVEAVKAEMSQDVPPADRSALCTTNGKPVEEVRAGQTNETGQHDGYIVLCAEERAKGFVRPYRDAYKHVGPLACGYRPPNDDLTICERAPGHSGSHQGGGSSWAGGEAPEDVIRRTQDLNDRPGMVFIERVGGCGTVTTMGRALSETYARDPKFYGATFCVTCNRHLPVAEFVWTADGQMVGS